MALISFPQLVFEIVKHSFFQKLRAGKINEMTWHEIKSSEKVVTYYHKRIVVTYYRNEVTAI